MLEHVLIHGSREVPCREFLNWLGYNKKGPAVETRLAEFGARVCIEHGYKEGQIPELLWAHEATTASYTFVWGGLIY